MRKKKLWISVVVVGFLIASSVSAQEGLRKVRIAYPSNTICCLPLFGALKWKVFEENGLQAEIIQVRSQLAYPAMSSGEVPYVAGVGPASISATLRGMQSKAVWFATEELIYSLIARPDFHNVKDLRNKKIALTGLGGTSHVALQISLEAVGENQKNFVYIGMGAQLLPALEAVRWEPLLSLDVLREKRALKLLDGHGQDALGSLTVMNSTIRNRATGLKRVIKSMQAKRKFSDRKSVAMIARFSKWIETWPKILASTEKRSAATVCPLEGIDQILKSSRPRANSRIE
jgi:hypothetical protein